jgi:phosphoadenosine phosphosulfate reductase
MDVDDRSEDCRGRATDEDWSAAQVPLAEPEALADRSGAQHAAHILEQAVRYLYPGRIALTSSFGAESVVLLHLLSQIAPDTPVLFLDTGKLFPETLAYKAKLVETLRLTDVRTVSPLPQDIATDDPSGYLWSVEPDQCCSLRKVEPLSRALEGFDAWITGRKRFQAVTRSVVPVFERDGARMKVNPLAGWTAANVSDYMIEHNLPRHPLVAHGYSSIGCATCTTPTRPGEHERAGRWRNRGKTECGIHESSLK